ncbi:hypothetical protein AGLY_015741 [Aphis glycines]|uniref:SWIM-type domain-containing protein n=1 Tax=Aphis glycines TaxID=307491 RepID=A0A6G0SZQ2_APHGL|nr:hypothetical protein AGLY_015741 [Aphis glycines]
MISGSWSSIPMAVQEQTTNKQQNSYKGNGGVTFPGTNFIRPGNKLVDDNGNANFNRLPDHCADWVAMEHDADYYNATVTNHNQIHEIEKIDDKAIDAAWNECFANQPVTTAALVAGLKTKNHMETLAEQAVFPFGSNEAVYPGTSSTQGKPITWFTKSNSRRRAEVEFNKWKSGVEEKEGCQYVKRTYQKQSGDKEYIYFFCHRSFDSRIHNNGKKSSKSGGSLKIGHVCPSNIVVHKETTKVSVDYCSTHLWHTVEIAKQRIPIEERNKIAGKLAIGVPVNRILDDIRELKVGTPLKRIHLIEKKDLHNIKRDYNISYNTKSHENDAVSVRLWVEDMKKKGENNPILYFKEQGENDENVPHFSKNDFCLIIMTQFQSEMFLKFGNDKVCIDGTHGLNSYNFQLYSLVIVDEYGNGFPVAFCFSNKCDTATYKHYFQCIKNTIGTINPSIFMSDDEPAFYNAWSNVMGPVEKQLLCTWHVLRNWSKNLNKIHSHDKKTIVFKTLKTLLHETDEKSFSAELSHVINQLINDADTADFGKYFISTYSTRVEKWAFFNRKHLGINTNMYLETLHKSIKYCYLEGKQCKRLDLSINALMLLVRDKSLERTIKITKKKRSNKLLQIISSHNKSKNILPEMIVKFENYWLVNSETEINIKYKVEKTYSSCTFECVLRCDKCHICIHSYKCTCLNNVVNYNICKHIHACATASEPVQILNLKLNVPVMTPDSNQIVIDHGLMNITNNNCNNQIKNKLEMILGMCNRTSLNGEDQNVLKHCDKILDIFAKNKDMSFKNTQTNLKRKIEPQTRFIQKKKTKLLETTTMSPAEEIIIKKSLKDCTDEVINISKSFDHSYI